MPFGNLFLMVGFILGAGFSRNAGIPVVSEISERFIANPLTDNVLQFTSGEWKWREWASGTDRHNGTLGGLRVPVCMVMDELIAGYLIEINSDELQYEAFYGYLKDIVRDGTRYQTALDSAKKRFIEQYGYHTENFDHIPIVEFDSFFFHLIADLLYLHIPTDQYIERYAPFVEILKRHGFQADIFSLNHDLLVECVFEHFGVPFSNGFSTAGSNLFGDDGSVISVYTESFGENVRLQKLHGGLDVYRYDYLKDGNRHLGYDYFSTANYYKKQVANHIVGSTVIQNFTSDIKPQFITGTNKFAVIHADKMYLSLHHRFINTLENLSELFIVGYSYGDDYINEIIEKSIENIKLIVNVNPKDKFRFSHKNVCELSSIEGLRQFA